MEFKEAVNHILKFEGGYVDNPFDPGGETKYGISKRAHPNVDIKQLTKQDAKEIYRIHYWERVQCDEMPERFRLIYFDAAVNHGVIYATKTLQSILGVTIDGIVGPQTIGTAKGYNVDKLIMRFAEARKNSYFDNRNFWKFGSGWITRLLTVTYLSAKQ